MYDGLMKPLKALDNDRVTSVILVTDAVTNTGVVEPKAFVKLLKQYDIRLFGFLLGNSANWPLMQIVCDVSGGYFNQVSNSDDIVGKVLQAKEKVVFECMHDAQLKIKGVNTHDTTNMVFKKVYRGEQLVVFGRYSKGGKATFTMKSRVSGQEKEYEYEIDLPEIDHENPELERIWAMSQVEMYDQMVNRGDADEKEFENVAREIGEKYQIVTDETSMLILSDESFKKHGIDRKNRERAQREHKAQAARSQTIQQQVNQPAQPVTVDNGSNNSNNQNNTVTTNNRRQGRPRRGFRLPRPSIGGGGGAVDPFTIVLLGLWSGLGLSLRKKED